MFVVWDDAKAEANLVKHGIDFETAKAVFEDPAHLVVAAKTVAGEPRRMALGRVDDELVLAVVHVVREIEILRIISARRASRKERRIYAKAS